MLAPRAALSLAPRIVLYFALPISAHSPEVGVLLRRALLPLPLLFVEVLLVLQCFLARAGARGVGAPAAPVAPASDAEAADARRGFWRAVVPVGACTAAEIALSNASLLTLSVSFHTMVKSSTPVFVMLSSFAIGLERARCHLVAIVLLIVAGVATLSAGGDLTSQPAIAAPDDGAPRPPFSPVGFALVVASAGAAARAGRSRRRCCSGTRALALLADMLPVAALCLLPFAAALDAPRAWRMARALDAAERAPLAVALGARPRSAARAPARPHGARAHRAHELAAVSISARSRSRARRALDRAAHDAISGPNWAVRAPPPPPPPPPCPPARRRAVPARPPTRPYSRRRAPTLREEASARARARARSLGARASCSRSSASRCTSGTSTALSRGGVGDDDEARAAVGRVRGGGAQRGASARRGGGGGGGGARGGGGVAPARARASRRGRRSRALARRRGGREEEDDDDAEDAASPLAERGRSPLASARTHFAVEMVRVGKDPAADEDPPAARTRRRAARWRRPPRGAGRGRQIPPSAYRAPPPPGEGTRRARRRAARVQVESGTKRARNDRDDDRDARARASPSMPWWAWGAARPRWPSRGRRSAAPSS